MVRSCIATERESCCCCGRRSEKRGMQLGWPGLRAGGSPDRGSISRNPLFARDGGHGMLFRTLDGELLLSIHQPNVLPAERPHFFRVKEAADGSLYLDGEFRP